jgi:hypothetical protein
LLECRNAAPILKARLLAGGAAVAVKYPIEARNSRHRVVPPVWQLCVFPSSATI